jgi:hypothetical protein
MTQESTPLPAADAEPISAVATPTPAPAAEAPAVVEPIAYQPFAYPEGMSVEPEALEHAHALFNEARLPQEQAQKFIDLAMAREKAAAERGVKAFHQLQDKWLAEIKADPEIGGDKLAAAVAQAAHVLERLAVPGLKEALNMTGAGNHPAVVKAFVRLGRLLAEDRFSPGREAAPQPPRTPADIIYGGQPRQ